MPSCLPRVLDDTNIPSDSSNAPSNCSAGDFDRWRKQPRRRHSVFDSKVCSFRKKRVDCLLDACRTDWSVSFPISYNIDEVGGRLAVLVYVWRHMDVCE